MASDTAHHTSHSLYKLQSLSRRFILLVAILVGVLTLAPAAQAQEETSAQLSASGQAIVAAINQARANAGLGALAVNPLLNQAAQRAPIGELVDIMDVGFTCAFLATPYARRVSGETLYVDGGVNIMA